MSRKPPRHLLTPEMLEELNNPAQREWDKQYSMELEHKQTLQRYFDQYDAAVLTHDGTLYLRLRRPSCTTPTL